MSNVIVFDIETVPDLKGFAAANGHVGKTDDEIRAELGDRFPKHIYHSIICIGALIAHTSVATFELIGLTQPSGLKKSWKTDRYCAGKRSCDCAPEANGSIMPYG